MDNTKFFFDAHPPRRTSYLLKKNLESFLNFFICSRIALSRTDPFGVELHFLRNFVDNRFVL